MKTKRLLENPYRMLYPEAIAKKKLEAYKSSRICLCRVCAKEVLDWELGQHQDCFWKLVADVSNRKPQPAGTAGGEENGYLPSTLDKHSLPQASAGK